MIEGVTIQFIVGDIRRASDWYTKVIGRGPDNTPYDDLIEWIITPAITIQVNGKGMHEQKGFSGRIRFAVDDIQEYRARIIHELRVEISRLEEIRGVVRWCNFDDPWGNKLGYYQDLSRHKEKISEDLEFF